MHIPMSEFEQITNSCVQVFLTWDDENDKVSQILREMLKKRRDQQESVKLSQRMPFKHKALENRLENLRKFRRQHEQLRTVISRVIRIPGDNKAGMIDVGSDGSDMNTIEQVRFKRDALN